MRAQRDGAQPRGDAVGERQQPGEARERGGVEEAVRARDAARRIADAEQAGRVVRRPGPRADRRPHELEVAADQERAGVHERRAPDEQEAQQAEVDDGPEGVVARREGEAPDRPGAAHAIVAPITGRRRTREQLRAAERERREVEQAVPRRHEPRDVVQAVGVDAEQSRGGVLGRRRDQDHDRDLRAHVAALAAQDQQQDDPGDDAEARCGQIEACESSHTPAAIQVTTTPAMLSSRRDARTAPASSDDARHDRRSAGREGRFARAGRARGADRGARCRARRSLGRPHAMTDPGYRRAGCSRPRAPAASAPACRQLGQLDDRDEQRVELEPLARVEILQRRGAVLADALRASIRRSMSICGCEPSAFAIARHSSIPSRASARVPGCRHIAASVARVSTLSGLKTALPSSLIQISSRRSGSTGALRPPATSASENRRQRSETAAVGLSEREARALAVADHARRLELRRAVDDAPDRALGRDRRARRAARIDGLDAPAVVRPAVPVEVPPRHAVLRGHDGGRLVQQRCQQRPASA